MGYSTISYEHARKEVENSSSSFESAAENAYEVWNQYLSAFKINTDDDELKQKFYSCLYHSLVKPCDMNGESVLDISGDTVTDFATFWDQYKTALPLIYMCYQKMSDRIVRGIINISRTLGKIPCNTGR